MFSASKLLLTITSLAVPVGGVSFYFINKIQQNPKYKNQKLLDSFKDFVGIAKDPTNAPASGAATNNIKFPENFLKIGNDAKKAEEILNDFLDTYTGSKILFEKIVEIFLDKVLEDTSKEWAGSKKFEEFKKKKDELIKNLENSEDFNSKTKLHGGNKDAYKKIDLLDNYKKLFVELLEENLDIYLDGQTVDDDYSEKEFNADKSKFEIVATNSQKDKKIISLNGKDLRDKFQKEISNIWNFIFEDWYKKEKPISIKKFTWKYDQKFQEKEYLFADADKDLIKIPENPNYYFPSFDAKTKEKFKLFATKIDDLDTEEKLLELNDYDNVDRVINVSVNNLNSREAIALLRLNNDEIFKDPSVPAAAPLPPAPQPQVAGSPAGGVGAGMAPGTGAPAAAPAQAAIPPAAPQIPSADCITGTKKIKKADLKNKDLLELFGIKTKETFPQNTDQVVDFCVITDEKAIIYRDTVGIHFVKKQTDDKKALLINTLEKQKILNNGKFDLFSALKTHFQKNFYVILMNYLYEKNVTANDPTKPSVAAADNCTSDPNKCVIKNTTCDLSNEKCLYQIGNSLSKLIESEKHQQKIDNLRNTLLKDYFKAINTQLITTESNDKIEKAKLLSKGYAVKFPEKINWNVNPAKIQLINSLEDIFNIETQPPQAASTFDAKFKTDFDAYKNNIKKLIKDKTTTKKEFEKDKKAIFTFIKEPLQGVVVDNKKIDIDLLLESIFIKGLTNNLIQQMLINKQKVSSIKNYDFDTNQYKNTINENELMDEFSTNYYKKNSTDATFHNTFINKLNNAIIMENNLSSLFSNNKFFTFKNWHSDIKDSSTLFKFLTDSEKEQRTNSSTDYVDALNVSYTKFVDQLNAIFWLTKNNFKNYQEHLKLSIRKEGFGAFVFTNKFNSKLCTDIKVSAETKTIETSTKDKWEKLWQYDKTASNIHKFANNELGDAENKNCVNLYDQFSLVKAITEKTTSKTTEKEISGYKGFVHAKNHSNIENLPKSFWNELSEKIKNENEFKSGHLNTTENSYTTYLFVLKKDDLQDFDKFLKEQHISLDMILHDIVKLSKNKSIQQTATEDFLSNNNLWIKTKKYEKFELGDWRLQNTIPFEWNTIDQTN